MELVQPQSSPTKKQIEDQNKALLLRVSDNEALIGRQTVIVNSNKYEIEQLSNQKAELESFVKKAEEAKKSIENDITVLQSEKDSLKSKNEETNLHIEERKLFVENQATETRKREDASTQRETALEAKEIKLNGQIAENTALKTDLDSKLKKLREIVNE